MMEVLRLPPERPDLPDAIFFVPDLTTFTRLDEFGLIVVGQRLEPDRAVLTCWVSERASSDRRGFACPPCGQAATATTANFPRREKDEPVLRRPPRWRRAGPVPRPLQ